MTYDEKMLAATRNLGDQLVESIEAHHFNPQLGQVWAALFIFGECADPKELAPLLAHGLDVDALLEELIDLGAVEQTSSGHIKAETDPLRLSLGLLRAQEMALVEELQEALDFATDKLAAAKDPRAQHSVERVKQLGRNMNLLHQLFSLLNKAGPVSFDTLVQTLGKGLARKD